jgi:hypothetical protein
MATVCTALIVGYKSFRQYEKNQMPDVTILGFVNMADGLGRMSVEMVQCLKDHVKVNFVRSREKKEMDYTGVPPEIKSLFKHPSKQLGNVVLFLDMLWYPDAFCLEKLDTPATHNQIRIAYSMFESTKIPPEWSLILNSYFDAVAVPDKFLIDVYKNSGVHIPVFELPLCLDLDPYLQQPLKTHSNKPFVFANLSTCTPRKNHTTLVRAFAKAFGNDKNVLLKINCREVDKKNRSVIKK